MNQNKLASVFKEKGITEYEIYHVEGSSTEVSTFNMEVDQNTVANKNELYIRGVYNGKIASVYVEKDTDDEIERVADAIVRNAKVIESDDPYVIYGGSKEYKVLPAVENDFDKYTQADFIAMCKDTETKFRERMKEITTTECSFEISSERVSITNSNGLNVSREQTVGSIFVSVVVTKDGESRPGYAFDTFNKVSDIDFEKLFARSAKRAYDSLGATSVPSKSYPVVFESYAACSLFRAFAPIFSGEFVVKKLSNLAGRLGEKVFGDNITIYDDPFAAESFQKYSFDDEGVATHTKAVVENGVLKTFLHDLKTAKMTGAEPTGNGFKFGHGMPANLSFKDSGVSFDDMIKDIKDGVYITSLNGLHAGVSATSGQFSIQSSGFKIVDGKVSSPVTLIIVSGNIYDLLNNVATISNDRVAVGHVVTGSVFVNNLSVSGN